MTAAGVTGRWLARALGGALTVVLTVLLIAWLTLHWGILPHIQQWRGSIETRATRAIGVPVRIGDIRVRSSGWVPSIELGDVTLQGPGDRPALRLPRVVAALSVRSLLSFELVFEQLLIEGAELDVQRDANGRIFVAGIAVDTGASPAGDDSHALDWFFRQQEFAIRGGSLRWTDALRGAPPLQLSKIDFVVRNSLRGHSIGLDGTPPAAWGERFGLSARFTQPLLARPGDWHRWDGTFYADLPRADLRELKRYADLPIVVDGGSGVLRGWVEVEAGEARAATLDLALRDLRLQPDPASGRLDFAAIEGRLAGRRGPDGFDLSAERLAFVTGDGERAAPGTLKLAWRQRADAPPAGGDFSADRLDLGLVARIASRLPLGAAVHRALGELRPAGVASAVVAHWDGPIDAPAHYRVGGKVRGLMIAALPSTEREGLGRPGVRNADLQLDATERGGSVRIDMAGGAFELPGLFDEPLLPLDRLGGRVVWTIEPGTASAPAKIGVQLQDVRLANADAHAELTARWSTGPGTGTARGGRFPGRLELDAKVGDAVAPRLARYLPLGISRGMRDYVRRAVQAGRVTAASFRVRGDLADFPFFNAPRLGGDKVRRSDGEFRIDAHVDDASFAYVPDAPGAAASAPSWPKLTRASVDLALDRNLLEIRNGAARIGETDIDRLGGRIEHLEADAALSLEATVHGPLAETLRFVDVSPVGGWIGGALAGAKASGGADMKLALGIPLGHPGNGSSVRGSLALTGNDLQISAGTPLLAGARGRVDFTQQGFAVVGATAKVYGGDASFEGGTQADGAIRFTGQGSATAEGLRRADELGPVSRLARHLAGRAGYRAALAFVHGEPEISVASNLVGIAVDLPAPFAKSAEAALAMHYQTTAERAEGGGAPREALQLDLGPLLQLRFLRESGPGGTRVVHGGIGVQADAPTPAAGVAASLNVGSLDLDAWQRIGEEVFPATPAAPGSPPAGSDTGPEGGYEPDRIALRAHELSSGGRRLTGLTAGLTRDGDTWRAHLDADQLAGTVEYRPPDGRDGSGRVYARLARLALPKTEAEQVSNLLDSPPPSVPALDVVIDDLDLRGTRLGRVEIVATNRQGGPRRPGQRDWQLTRLAIKTPEAELTGTGRWAASPVPAPGNAAPPRRMSIDFRLQVADGGALLDRLGTKGAIRGGAGVLKGQVGWQGSPLAIDFPSLSGQVNVDTGAGQFLKADPGAARLLGVLSLQSLPRRLSLDFRDVFAQGFAFDSFAGDVRIAQGVAETDNLRMRGVQATVLMEGSADIGRETQDLRVVVVPEINAGTAALAYAAINPAIGLGAFLAQWLLRKPLMAAGTREFHITGAWDDPKVDPVAKGATAAAADLSAATSAASAPARNP